MTFFATSGVKPGKTRRSGVRSSRGQVAATSAISGSGTATHLRAAARPACLDSEAGAHLFDVVEHNWPIREAGAFVGRLGANVLGHGCVQSRALGPFRIGPLAVVPRDRLTRSARSLRDKVYGLLHAQGVRVDDEVVVHR